MVSAQTTAAPDARTEAASQVFLDELSGKSAAARNPIGLPGLKPVYFDDFLEDPHEGWTETCRTINRTPVGERPFLGPFGPDFVSLELSDLPPHKLLVISFDLYAIKSWDGNLHPYGPDIWELSLLDGPVLWRTTFSNWGGRYENYPDNYPSPLQTIGRRAAERNTLGYRHSRGDNDAVYRIFAVCPHTRDSLKLRFIGRHFDPSPRDQSWGIADFSISVAETLNPLSEEQLRENWDRLGDRSPMAAVDAMWTLVSAGDRAAELIGARLESESGGPRSAYSDGESPESWRLRRAVRALRVIGSPAAKRVLWRLEEPGRFPSDEDRYSYSNTGR